MATHSRDGAAEIPVAVAGKTTDRRIPLRRVKFTGPTVIDGINTMMVTELTAGERRIVDGKDWLPPDMWLDRELRVIKIGALAYPLERVHMYEQATAAITKKPPPLDLEKFTIGKRK